MLVTYCVDFCLVFYLVLQSIHSIIIQCFLSFRSLLRSKIPDTQSSSPPPLIVSPISFLIQTCFGL